MRVLIVSILVGCGVDCEREDRTGLYRTQMKHISGSCGSLADGNEVLINGYPLNGLEGCSVDYESWSDDECTVERAVTCHGPDGYSVGKYKIEQEDDDGLHLSGTLDATVYNNSGTPLCSSLHKITSERK